MRRHEKSYAVAITALVALLIGGGYFVLRKMEIATADDAVRNRLRNLSALADDYFAKTGATSVHVTQLDMVALYNAGIRDPMEELQPAVIHKWRPLVAPSFDGEREMKYLP